MDKHIKKNKKYSVKSIVLAGSSFCIPVLILIFIYILGGLMFYGEKSIITGDCEAQYTAFLAYMREILSGNRSPYYTFSKVLGGDLASFLSYYTLSPFNIFLLFFQNIHIQEAVLFLILIKSGIAGLSMFSFLNAKKKEGKKWLLLFSTAYALMSYNIVYQHNIMWMDGLVFLPIVIRGVEKLVDSRKIFDKKNTLYLCSLAFLLLSNYYIGYMICIFTALYVVYYIFFDEDMKSVAIREKWHSLKAFAVNSILAGGIAAVSLLPTAFSLRGGKAEFRLTDLLDSTILYAPFQVWKELFSGSYAIKNDLNTLPNIYCGVVILVCVAVYFATGKISRREKAGNLALLAVLYLSFIVAVLDRIWHGTTVPAGAPHRYSFLFSFMLIVVAYKGVSAICTQTGYLKVEIMEGIKTGVLCGAFLICYVVGRNTADSYMVFNIALFVFILAGILLNGVAGERHNIFKYIVFMIPISALIDLTLNGVATVNAINYNNRLEFANKVSLSREYVEWVKNQDKNWYRMEQCGTNTTMNDAMLFQYNGLWSYSSCEKENTKRLAGKLGLNDMTWWITYHNEVPAASESLLGLKYIITSQPLAAGKDYTTLQEFQEEQVKVYKNPYALPLGILVREETAETNMDTWDVLAMENDLWKRMTGESEDIYLYAEREEIKCEEHLIEYRLVIENEFPVYTCFRNYGTIEEMLVLVNGEQVRQLTPEMQTYCLGTYQKGDVLTIRISNQEAGVDMSWYDLYFYYENMENLKEYSALLQGQGMQLTEYAQDRLSGLVSNETESNQLLLLTIPADQGWSVLVDGIVQPIRPVAGGFLGVTIPQGQHRVSCTFVPIGMWQGASISLIAICILVIGSQGDRVFAKKDKIVENFH